MQALQPQTRIQAIYRAFEAHIAALRSEFDQQLYEERQRHDEAARNVQKVAIDVSILLTGCANGVSIESVVSCATRLQG